MIKDTARIIEIFSSIQGEGPLVGVRQIFLRFFGCNIHCLYCDTPNSLVLPEEYFLETYPGSREFEKRPNPVTAEDVERAIACFARTPHHSVSLTGGEPLVHASFLQSLLPRIKPLGLGVYLETNGILSSQLESVIEWIDTVSMDIKLPHTLDPAHDYFEEHEEFLRLAIKKQVFVKLVILPDTPELEVARVAELVHSVGSQIPLILQPVTPDGKVVSSPSAERMLLLHSVASSIHPEVRVIPQVHRLIGQL